MKITPKMSVQKVKDECPLKLYDFEARQVIKALVATGKTSTEEVGRNGMENIYRKVLKRGD